ncbi:hypothetical protein A2U01_0062128, partial [Trifolium medium]|nr:hypothetical protein [Trifolium medium]
RKSMKGSSYLGVGSRDHETRMAMPGFLDVKAA